jgi:DNA-binding PadR family transcriptional regulator
MCSDSLGGIQAAIKRLLDSGKVTFREFVENGVNKKQYSITGKGRADLLSWVNTPAMIANPKNMELGKYLSMGLVKKEDRRALINEAIEMLNQEMSYLMAIYNGLKDLDLELEIDNATGNYEKDAEYYDGLKKATGFRDLRQFLSDYVYYEKATLQYGIDITKFQIEWLSKLSENAGKENNLGG